MKSTYYTHVHSTPYFVLLHGRAYSQVGLVGGCARLAGGRRGGRAARGPGGERPVQPLRRQLHQQRQRQRRQVRERRHAEPLQDLGK